MQILANFVVVVTRPRHQAKNLVEHIQNLGGHCILFPTLEIIRLKIDFSSISRVNWKKIIFTSANAVPAILPIWKELAPKPTVFAIGSGTAAALGKQGINAILPEKEFSSEGLLALNDLKNIRNDTILIITGENGRGELAEGLGQRGASIEVLPVYKRKCPEGEFSQEWQKWRASGINLIISTSSESLENLWQMAKTGEDRDWLCNQQLLVISPRMVELAHTLGFIRQPLLAKNASEPEIMNRLIAFAKLSKPPEHLVK